MIFYCQFQLLMLLRKVYDSEMFTYKKHFLSDFNYFCRNILKLNTYADFYFCSDCFKI
ncbi:Uncharacterized protein dnm_025300 [Desulfonema magnum]|uniref:Uncharacterized protein n=1 Tax=Desulfonema magnum TaxID=45655 RepID=A0A975BJC6_9BACT|nr:Uncharacterized protein dnm_025300 [Desulfonema magnum]